MYPLFVVPQTAHRHGLVSTLGACATLVSLTLPMLAQQGSGWGREHNTHAHARARARTWLSPVAAHMLHHAMTGTRSVHYLWAIQIFVLQEIPLFSKLSDPKEEIAITVYFRLKFLCWHSN